MSADETQVNGDVAANTAEQKAAHKAQEAAWAEESTWPIYQVVIEGDEVEWVAREGVNLDDDGTPQPWTAKAVATVSCHARSEEHAKMLALRDNPTYHTITSVKKITDGE